MKREEKEELNSLRLRLKVMERVSEVASRIEDFEKTLSYRIRIDFDIVGLHSGDYDTSVYVDVDFSDFVKAEHDICSTGGE